MWSAGETIWARSEFRWRAGWALEWVERDGCIEAKLYGLFRELSDRKRAREPANDRGVLAVVRGTPEEWPLLFSLASFPSISSNWEPCTVKWGSRTPLALRYRQGILKIVKNEEKDWQYKTSFVYSYHGETKEQQLLWVKIYFLALLFKKT